MPIIIPANEGFTLLRKRTNSASAVIFSNDIEFTNEMMAKPHDNENNAVVWVAFSSICDEGNGNWEKREG